MSKDIYTVQGFVETIYDPTIKTIIVTWKNLGPHNYLRPCLEAQVECVREDGAKVILVNTATAKGVLSQVDQSWLATDVFPVYEEHGVKAVITVVPKQVFAKLAARQWQKTGRQFGVDFVDTGSYEAALELAKKYVSGDIEALETD